ncbi:substrate-binding periplasmic protein [Salinimonas lutimaris]|uniref:substrate-binding periplasmic protein n=1 Tax=Salinimonas lutimaris TaxID=914153 RepID=UPI0010BFFB02|nr:amino acid ABC transporter substrate-binding protein [Salinimonas lutimaris]
MRFYVIRLLLILSVLLFSRLSTAEHFVVGAQNIAYYPHYDFTSRIDKGLGWAILQAYAKASGHTFSYLAMPTMRLQRELIKGHVDFVYPDNPRWHMAVPDETHKFFSKPFVMTTGATFVTRSNASKSLGEVNSVAYPLGFSPDIWSSLLTNRQVALTSVTELSAAFELLVKNRVDAATLEYTVAQHLIHTSGRFKNIIVNPALPIDQVGFRLSSLNHPSIIDDLNTFITSHPDIIADLYERYNIAIPPGIEALAGARFP